LAGVGTLLEFLEDGVGGSDLVERADRDDQIGLHEVGQVPFVDPRMVIFITGFPHERIVVSLDRVGPLGSFDDAEIHLPCHARDLGQDVSPVGDEVEHVIRRRDIEGVAPERQMGAVREDDVAESFGEAELDHRPRDVDADDSDPALLEGHRVTAGTHSDLEDSFPVELVHEDPEDPGHRAGRESPRRVVDRGDPIEG